VYAHARIVNTLPKLKVNNGKGEAHCKTHEIGRHALIIKFSFPFILIRGLEL